jgi:hypothetical protein
MIAVILYALGVFLIGVFAGLLLEVVMDYFYRKGIKKRSKY